ncbi:Protocadherin gamma-B7 [Lemmus lemmus]
MLVLLSALWAALWEASAGQIRYSVPEEIDKGSFVGSIAKDLGLEPLALAERGVRIVSRGRSQLFALNPRSGSLVTAGRIDREELCAQSTPCLMNFNLLLEDKLTIYSVEVEVTDVNDNAPRFGVEEPELKISETTTPGFRIPLKSAHDADVGENTLQKYELNSNDHFSLDVRTGADGNKYPELVLERALDREEEAVHHLVLVASDGGNPVRSGTCRIRVKVLDANDNAPAFTQPEYRVSVPENMPIGTRILTVTATDQDEGVNAEITYAFHNVDEQVERFFNLDKQTGEITTRDNLDFETAKSYSLNVEAKDPGDLASHCSVQVEILDENDCAPEVIVTSVFTPLPEDSPLDREQQNFYRLVLTALDGGNPPLSGTTELRIQVTDANDNPPVFNQEVYRVRLPENVPPGTTVLQVTATDKDEGANGEVTYSFRKLLDTQLLKFQLDKNTGEIKISENLDYEEMGFYEIEIQAEDGGAYLATAKCKVIIEVLDENDNRPEIIITSLSDQILEDSLSGTVVALFKVRDRDSGENAEVSCSLSRDSPFKIHSSSNNYYKLVTDSILDREQTPGYNITITATDRGKPPLSSSITITLHVADVNDNAPVFQQPAYLVNIPENNQPGTSITQVKAWDPDLGPNGLVSYSIIASDLDPKALSSFVSVNQDSGVVFAQRAFDHEQLRSFQLTLQARDQGSPALSANVSMRVLVGDLNDNAPRVLYPALEPDGSALFDMVPRAAEPGYLVTKVVAVDADSGHNAWLSYHVLQASDPGLFSLGLRSGEVRTARALGEKDAARQRLLVAVRDGGQPPLSATATLLLVFADSLQEALPDLVDYPSPSDSQSELQFYLVVALALISVLFLLAIILAIALRLRKSSNPSTTGCFGSVLGSKSPPVLPPNYSEGTLPYAYNLCVPGDQAKPDFNFLTSVGDYPAAQDILNKDSSSALLASILTPSVEADEKTFNQVFNLTLFICQ